MFNTSVAILAQTIFNTMFSFYKRRKLDSGFLPVLNGYSSGSTVGLGSIRPGPVTPGNSTSACSTLAVLNTGCGSLPKARAPVVREPTRGTRRGTNTPLDNDLRLSMLRSYEGDTRANSAWGPNCSLKRTWTHFHCRWYGTDEHSTCATPVLPLTVGSIRGVIAQMKELGYRSVPNYVSAVKDAHISSGFVWCDMLDREARRAGRTALRGIGPAKQCGDFDLDEVVALQLGDEPLSIDGPLGPGRLAELGCFHLLRDMESSCALASHLVLDTQRMTESLELPVSKTDPTAIGCVRSWGCVCDGLHSTPCAYHAALEHMDMLNRMFAQDDGTLPADLPLFPNRHGRQSHPDSVVEMVNAIARRLNLPLTDKFGRNRFGKHVFRVSGARKLAALGIATAIIMLLARWSSQVVLRYIADSPLATLTSQYRDRALGEGAKKEVKGFTSAEFVALRDRVTEQEARIDQMHAEHTKQDNVLRERVSCLERMKHAVDLPFVRNTRSGKWHHAGAVSAMMDPHFWCTPCGWKYAHAPFARSEKLPINLHVLQLCDRCLPAEREALQSSQANDSEDEL